MRSAAGVVLVLMAGWAAAGATSRAGEPPPKCAAAFTEAEYASELLAQTNEIRRENHLPPLAGSRQLDAAADDQASLMALRLVVEHESAIPGEATPPDRVQRRGVKPNVCAENIASVIVGEGDQVKSGPEIARLLMAAWMESPGHRANILNRRVTQFGGSVHVVRGPHGIWYAFGDQVFVLPAFEPDVW